MKRPDTPGTCSGAIALWPLLLLAFALRVLASVLRDGNGYLEDGYGFYRDIAHTFLEGGGFCMGLNSGCAIRMPLYPLFLSGFFASNLVPFGVVVAQAALGTMTAWLIWRIGVELFDPRVGVGAAALTAVNPYAVMHDTALQETVLVNVLLIAAIYAFAPSRSRRTGSAATGGLLIALAVLTTARVALFIPLAVASTLLLPAPTRRAVALRAAMVILPVALLVGGWMVRNWYVVGAPVLTTESGEGLWLANDDWTFSHYPVRSIDLSTGESYAHLPPERQRALSELDGDEVAVDRLMLSWGIAYITADPLRAARSALRKVWVVVSAQLSPARSPLVQAGYALFFLPFHILAVNGIWESRHTWRDHVMVYALVTAFFVTTAVFWAHTSHKSYLDPLIFLYGVAGGLALWRRQ